MNENGMSKLRSLLFQSEGELVNVKFFPGNSRALTRDQLAEAGASLIGAAREAWASGEASNPPRTNVAKRQLVG